jgi:alpha-glucosidase
MKEIKITGFIFTVLAFISSSVCAQDTVKSPNGQIKVTVSFTTGKLSYTVSSGSENVIDQSDLGINTSLANFTSDLTYVSSTVNKIDETYQLPSGKTSNYVNNCNELDIKLTKGTAELHVVFRAYNDGIAYKYVIPGAGSITVYGETSNINIASFEKCWGQKFLSDYSTHYPERDWTATSAIASFCAPILCKSGNNWCLITEAANYGTYCVSTIKPGTASDTGSFYFQLTGNVNSLLKLSTPWRTAIIGSLSTVTESVIIENLNPASTMTDMSWIKPGKASWDWGGQEAKSPWNTLEIAKNYVDLAFNMGWEYFMLDDGWESASYQLSEVIAYANTKGIGVLLWTNSNRFTNDFNQIRPILQNWKNLGFKGIKVDFWTGDQQTEIQKYDKVISLAAELKLLANMHGCTHPSGIRRRWPNLLTTEAVWGGEIYLMNGNETSADHNINLVFTRNVIGPMDYTPTNFLWADQTLRTLTTWSHQLALATMYESGLQHFIDCPNGYLNSIAGGYLRDLPVTWNETKLLDGEPNQYATMARRKGENWYVASLCNDARTLNLNLSFLTEGKSYTAQIYKDGNTDFDIKYEEVKVKKDDLLPIILRAHGGVTVRISEIPIEKPSFDSYEAEASVNSFSGQAVITADTDGKCSNNALVGYIGTGSTVTIKNVNAPKAGQYVLGIYYMTANQRDTYIKVNNQAQVLYSFPSTGGYFGSNMALKKVKVILAAGLNTITFGNDTDWGINLDKIVVNPDLEVNNVGITEITAPTSAYGLSDSEKITVKIKNESANEQVNVPVSYTIDNTTPVKEYIPSIPAQSLISYTFSKTADLHKGIAAYRIFVKTELNDDTHPADDTLLVVVNNTINTTEVNKIIENGIQMYPSVTNSLVHVKFIKIFTQSTLSIIDSKGQVFYRNSNLNMTQNAICDIDLTNYPAGLYILKLSSLEGNYSMKIIKK